MVRLFEIEGQDKHALRSLVQAFGKYLLRGIGQVGTVLVQHVAKPKAEFEFGNKFEEGQIEITAHSDLQHHVEGLGLDFGVFTTGQVVGRLYASDDIGAEVIETRGTDFEIERQGYEGGFHILRFAFSVGKVAKGDMLAAEMQSGQQTKGHILVKFPFTEHTDAEAQPLPVALGQPLVTCIGIDIAVVVEFQPLIVHTDEESVMKTALVNKGLVLYLSLLGTHFSPC